MKKKNLLFVVLTCMMLVLTSCNAAKSAQAGSEDAFLGVVLTQEYRNDSRILTLDDNLKKMDKKSYPVANLYAPSVRSVCFEDSVFLVDMGNSDFREDGKILEINRKTGEEIWHEFGRTNITGVAVDQDYIYVVSNLNQSVIIDRMDRKTQEMISMAAPNIMTSIFKCGDYLIGIELLDNGEAMCIVDVEKGACQSVITTSGEFYPMADYYNEKIIYSVDGELCTYDPQSGLSETISDKYDEICAMQILGDSLYYLCDSVSNGGNLYRIMCLNFETMNTETIYESEEMLLQMEVVSDHNLMIVDYERIFLYDVEASEETASYRYDNSGYYLGGFYLMHD